MDEKASIFIAINVLENTKNANVKFWEIDNVKKFSFKDVLSMINKNLIDDGLTIGAILKAKLFLEL